MREPVMEGPNHNNLREYEPYRETGSHILVDMDWWLGLADCSRDLIVSRSKNKIIELTSIKTPHEIWPKNDATVYLAYVDSFDFHHWADRVDNAKLYEIPEPIKKKMVTATVSGSNPHPDILDWLPDLPWPKCFARLSSTSGKNERRPFPIESKQDLVRFLVGNMILVRRELAVDKPSYLVLRPWIDLEHRDEFRAFFVQGKVRAVSQQHTKEFHHFTQKEVEKLEAAIPNMTFDVPYQNLTADVIWNGESFDLIECNPFGAHSGAGSGLFDWNDFPQDLTFRYKSFSKYI